MLTSILINKDQLFQLKLPASSDALKEQQLKIQTKTRLAATRGSWISKQKQLIAYKSKSRASDGAGSFNRKARVFLSKH